MYYLKQIIDSELFAIQTCSSKPVELSDGFSEITEEEYNTLLAEIQVNTPSDEEINVANETNVDEPIVSEDYNEGYQAGYDQAVLDMTEE